MVTERKTKSLLNTTLRRITGSFFLLIVTIQPHLEGQNWLSIATQKGKTGFIDESGKWKIKPVFNEVTGFHNGLAAVRSGNLWGYINNRGDYVIPPGYDQAEPFYNRQFAAVMKGPEKLYINRKGEILFDSSRELVIYYEDLAALEMNGRFGFINKKSEWEILPQYDQVWPFRNGLAKVKKEGQWIYINRLGKEMHDVEMDSYSPGDKALLFKKSKDKRWGFINSEGEWIISPVYDGVKSFSEGLSPVKIGKLWGYINMKGELVIQAEYEDAFAFSHWLGCVEVDGNYGCIDTRGNMVIKSRFEYPLFFHFAEDYLGLDIASAGTLEDIVLRSEIAVPEVVVASNTIYEPDEMRLALIIGNGNYTRGGFLSNPENDARAMAEALKRLGFETEVYFNVDQVTMKQAIDDFGNRLRNFETGLFFYAGHGIQVKGYNYLIPVDASLENEIDVEYNCVEAGRVLSRMEESGTRTNIVILDACRDNPFERSWTRKARGQGLAFMNAPSGSLIAYATSPGSTASDGPGKNGLYTSALLVYMNSPGLTILEVFQKVRSEVRDKSNNRQTPWESTSLEGNFYFRK